MYKYAGVFSGFFFHDPATTEIYTLSLHDALPISCCATSPRPPGRDPRRSTGGAAPPPLRRDRKSTRLNSSHPSNSYAVFCLKKKILIFPQMEFPYVGSKVARIASARSAVAGKQAS